MKSTIRKSSIAMMGNIFMLALYFFAITCLYSDKYQIIYNFIIIGEFLIAISSVILSRRKLNRIVNCRFVWWLLAVFILYYVWALFRTTYTVFSYAYITLHLINTLTIVFLFIDKKIDEIENIFCKGSIIGSILSIIFVTINEFEIILRGGERIGISASGNVDVFGMYLGVMSIFTLYIVIIKKKRVYMIPYVLQVLFMLLTGSKQALLYIIISYIMFIRYSYKGNTVKYVVPFLLGIGMIIAIFNVPFLYSLVGQRIKTMLVSFGINFAGEKSSHSTDLRLSMIRTALKLFTEHPGFGGGWGYFTEYSPFNTYSHCNYTEILVTYGILGFALYYLFFFKETFKLVCIKERNSFEQLTFVLLCAILAGDIARITFSQTALNYVIAFVAWKVIDKRYEY